MVYVDWNGREQEDIEMDAIRLDQQREEKERKHNMVIYQAEVTSNVEDLTQESAEKLMNEIITAMGEKYCVGQSVTRYGDHIVALWTRRVSKQEWECSWFDQLVTTFSTVRQWNLFQDACRAFSAVETDRLQEENIIDQSRDWCSEEVTGRNHP